MPILIISANPLFKEVIATIIDRIKTELIELSPEEAQTKIQALKPRSDHHR